MKKTPVEKHHLAEEPSGGGINVQTYDRAENKKRTMVRVGRRSVSVQDYFCRVASVCSSCGLWIRDVHEDVGWSRWVLFCVPPSRNVPTSHQLSQSSQQRGTPPPTPPTNMADVCIWRKPKTLQRQSG